MLVFISREIDVKSIFYRLLDHGHTVIGKSLVDIQRLPFTNVTDSDWLFFYSKYSIVHFFEQVSADQKATLATRKYGVMGESNALLIKKYIGKNPEFVSTSDLEVSKRKFESMTINQSILFVKAADSRSSFESFVSIHRKSTLLVYENVCSKEIELPYCDVLVFTSPLNAKAYFQHYPPNNAQKVISIGKTTTLYLQDKCGVKKVRTSHSHDDAEILSSIESALQM